MYAILMRQTPFYRSSNKIKRVDLLMIELEHLNSGFEPMDIEQQTIKALTKFTKIFIERTQTS